MPLRTAFPPELLPASAPAAAPPPPATVPNPQPSYADGMMERLNGSLLQALNPGASALPTQIRMGLPVLGQIYAGPVGSAVGTVAGEYLARMLEGQPYAGMEAGVDALLDASYNMMGGPVVGMAKDFDPMKAVNAAADVHFPTGLTVEEKALVQKHAPPTSALTPTPAMAAWQKAHPNTYVLDPFTDSKQNLFETFNTLKTAASDAVLYANLSKHNMPTIKDTAFKHAGENFAKFKEAIGDIQNHVVNLKGHLWSSADDELGEELDNALEDFYDFSVSVSNGKATPEEMSAAMQSIAEKFGVSNNLLQTYEQFLGYQGVPHDLATQYEVNWQAKKEGWLEKYASDVPPPPPTSSGYSDYADDTPQSEFPYSLWDPKITEPGFPPLKSKVIPPSQAGKYSLRNPEIASWRQRRLPNNEAPEWLRDTKAATNKGEIIELYHATGHHLANDVLDPKQSRGVHAPGPGVYFTDRPAASSSYARGEHQNYQVAYLNVKNPLYWDKELKPDVVGRANQIMADVITEIDKDIAAGFRKEMEDLHGYGAPRVRLLTDKTDLREYPKWADDFDDTIRHGHEGAPYGGELYFRLRELGKLIRGTDVINSEKKFHERLPPTVRNLIDKHRVREELGTALTKNSDSFDVNEKQANYQSPSIFADHFARAVLRELGYDSLTHLSPYPTGERHRVWVAWNKDQIVPATEARSMGWYDSRGIQGPIQKFQKQVDVPTNQPPPPLTDDEW